MKDLATITQEGKTVAEQNGVTSLFATSDGQYFLPGKKNLADLHAKEIKGVVHTLDYSEKKSTQPSTAKKAPAKK